MRNQDKNTFVIYSVFQAGECDLINNIEHAKQFIDLKNKGYMFKELEGAYNGVKEKSIIVFFPFDPVQLTSKNIWGYSFQAREISNYIFQQANRYKQECIMHVDLNRQARLMTTRGEHIDTLGEFRKVSQDVALASKGYTLDIYNNQYYICI